MSLFPLASFVQVDQWEADRALEQSEHYLGPCDRPFGKQSFGLLVGGRLVSVAVSASTVSESCAGRHRTEVVELARLGTLPGHRAWTRVALRCWREIAPEIWGGEYWPVKACVSYSNETRHKGDVYRFDGWRKVAVMPGSGGGGTWTGKQPREDKAVWLYELPPAMEAIA